MKSGPFSLKSATFSLVNVDFIQSPIDGVIRLLSIQKLVINIKFLQGLLHLMSLTVLKTSSPKWLMISWKRMESILFRWATTHASLSCAFLYSSTGHRYRVQMRGDKMHVTRAPLCSKEENKTRNLQVIETYLGRQNRKYMWIAVSSFPSLFRYIAAWSIESADKVIEALI